MNDKQLRALGRVTKEFQTMELAIKFLVHVLLDRDEVIGTIITSQLSFQRLCKTCEALFRRRIDSDDSKNRIEELVKRALAAEGERNKYLHSHWLRKAVDGEDGPMGRIKPKLKKGELTIDIEELDDEGKVLNDLADEMQSIRSEIVGFMAKHFVPDK